jgi:LysM repeat protein
MTLVKNLLTITLSWLALCQTSVTLALNEECSYHVIKVHENDTLSIRFGPHVKYRKMGEIPHDGSGIELMGPDLEMGESRWVPISYEGIEGWVNRGFLEERCQLPTLTNPPIYHEVASGDTLFSIANDYGYLMDQLIEWNDLKPPYNLPVGRQLRVYPQQADNCLYHIIKVSPDDMLWIRAKPDGESEKVGAIPYDGKGIEITGPEKSQTQTLWVPIKYKGVEGWVNRAYLESDC